MAHGVAQRAKIKLNVGIFDEITAAMGLGSDAAVARMLGVHRSTVLRLRAGSVEPSADVMYQIAEKLGIHVTVIFTREHESTEA
jgi:transcriptional regulator with XRE-family HTH domain